MKKISFIMICLVCAVTLCSAMPLNRLENTLKDAVIKKLQIEEVLEKQEIQIPYLRGRIDERREANKEIQILTIKLEEYKGEEKEK